MKKLLMMIGAAVAVHAAFGGDYPYSSAALTNVTVTGGFWLPRFETNRLVTLKADFEKCELERIPNFRRATGRVEGLYASNTCTDRADCLHLYRADCLHFVNGVDTRQHPISPTC